MESTRLPILNLSYLTAGNLTGYGISVLLLPLLTRCYEPEQFGRFAFLWSLSQILGLAGTLRLEKAFFVADSQEEIEQLGHIAYRAVMALTLLTAILIGAANAIFTLGTLATVLLWLPITAAAQSIILIETAEGNVRNRYARSGIARGLQGAGASVAALILSFTPFAENGLVLGFFLSQSLVALGLVLSGQKSYRQPKQTYRTPCSQTIRKHKNFIRFTAPHEISGALSAQATSLLIPTYFGSGLAGLFFLAQKCVMLPSVLVGTSTAQVYFHEVSACRHDVFRRRTLFYKFMSGAGATSAIAFTTIYLFAPDIIVFVFGPNWTETADYCRILAPWAALHLVGSVLSQTPQAMGAQKTAMFIEWANALTRIGLLSLGFLLSNAALGITLFIASSILFSGGRILWYSRLIRKSKNA